MPQLTSQTRNGVNGFAATLKDGAMKNRGIFLLLLVTASVARAETFDFTGFITSTENIGVSNVGVAVGTPVTGSFSLDFGNAQSVTGRVGSALWSVNEASIPPNPGIFPTSAPPTVFALDLQAGSFRYSSVPADQSAFNESGIAGHGHTFSAFEQANPAAFGIYGSNSSTLTLDGFTRSGVPGSHDRGFGVLTEGLMGSYYDVQDFSIRSVTRVAPELDPDFAAGSCALLLGLLTVLRGARRRMA